MDYVAAALIGYILGSTPVSLLVARRHGVDLYATADGNPGAWNALEQLGPRRAWPAFAGDGLKGTVAAGAGLALGGTPVAYAALASAMLGHAFPLFARFRGGKAVMTFVGGAPVLSPPAAVLALAAAALAGRARRSFAVGVRAGVFAFPLAQLLVAPAAEVAATGALMCLIGALFAWRGRSARARPARGAAPTP
jgi:acyl phosphate:glycerol-3-phosphate acyltransferase